MSKEHTGILTVVKKPDSLVKVDPKEAHALASDYRTINRRIRELVPGTLELCDLLHDVKTRELYRFGSPAYETFREWAVVEHGLGQSTITQYSKAGSVNRLLTDASDVALKPTNNSQLRPLLALKTEQEQKQVWKKAVELSKAEPVGKGNPITSTIVSKAKRMIYGKSKTGPKPPRQRLRRVHAEVWAAWPPDQKDQFINTLWSDFCKYFRLLDEADFADKGQYKWLKKHVPDKSTKETP